MADSGSSSGSEYYQYADDQHNDRVPFMAKTPVAPAAPNPPRAPSAGARKRSAAVGLDTLPGHHIRRLQQIAVALFLQEAEPLGVTPVQYAVLQAVANEPGLDQRTLAGRVALDTSTVAGVVDRLEARALLQRHASATDRRVRQLQLTPEGEALRAQVEPAMRRAQQRILAPLPRAERAEFLRLLRVLVDGNNEASRAPGELG
jgi:MarR family transcriptional regulator, lower aerobic nicotinate degradation pathway regulator